MEKMPVKAEKQFSQLMGMGLRLDLGKKESLKLVAASSIEEGELSEKAGEMAEKMDKDAKWLSNLLGEYGFSNTLQFLVKHRETMSSKEFAKTFEEYEKFLEVANVEEDELSLSSIA